MKKSTKIGIAAGTVLLGLSVLTGGYFVYRHYNPGRVEQPEAVEIETREKQSTGLEGKLYDKSFRDFDNSITLASFNIQVFGKSKRSKPGVMRILTGIVSSYDITAIQEFRDKEMKTLPIFVDQINSRSEKTFSYVGSPRLGRTNSKERYGFVFDVNRVRQIGRAYVWPDPEDIFEREPFIVQFKSGNFDYTLVNVHIKPKDATREIMALETVVNDILISNNERDVIVLGDFNADGDYFNENISGGIRSNFYTWVIDDSVDTTLARSDYTYDRIVFLTQFTTEDFKGTSGVFRFDEFYNLDPVSAKKVSDHYPIYAEFYTNRDSD